MKSIGIIGGGISGLSAAYYLTRLAPSVSVHLFEKHGPGGWIQTMNKDGFTFETGPRSIRLNLRSREVMEIASQVGCLDKIVFSSKRVADSQIYADGELFRLLPEGQFRMLKGILTVPIYRKLFLLNFCLPKPRAQPVEDESIPEFMSKYLRFWSEEDKKWFIETFLDAFQQGIYLGDINKLSARSCLPFSHMFMKKYYPSKYHPYKDIMKNPDVIRTYKKGISMKSNAFNFQGGLSTLINALLENLRTYPNFTYHETGVTSVKEHNSRGVISTSKENFEVDQVISTLPSNIFSGLLEGYENISELCNKVTHKSIFTLNVGFKENHRLDGLGYLVPNKENSKLAGVLFDSTQFTNLKPCVSVMGKVSSKETTHELTKELMQDFRKQTQCDTQIATILGTYWENALPQYNVGHYKIVEQVEQESPNWLKVSGQSLYPSGIPNCVLTSKNLVNSLVHKPIA